MDNLYSHTRPINREFLNLYLGKDHQGSKKRVSIWGKTPAQSVNYNLQLSGLNQGAELIALNGGAAPTLAGFPEQTG